MLKLKPNTSGILALFSAKQGLKLLSLFVVLAVSVTSLSGIYTNTRALAAPAGYLNFQARLLGANGAIVQDGFYNVEFKLYNQASAGTPLWTETRIDSNGAAAGSDARVMVKSGYLSVSLGEVNDFTGVDFDQDLWLTMNIGGLTQTATPTFDGEMNPRLRLTSVPFAYQANRANTAASAETLNKNTGGFTGTVDFNTLTADRRYLFPDTSLATTASPGTICVFNGAASNCPAASGSAFYIQNDTMLQPQSNINIQARDSGINGTIGTIIRGAAAGQTVDLLQVQETGGSVVFSVGATGNLFTNGTLSVADTSTFTGAATFNGGLAVENNSSISQVGTGSFSTGSGTVSLNGNTTIATGQTFTVTDGATTLGGTLEVTGISTFSGDAQFNGNVTIAAEKTITLVGGTTAQRPLTPTEGMLYYDQTTKQLLIYANGKWQADRSSNTVVVGTSAAGGLSGATASKAPDGADFVNTSDTSAQTVINAAIATLPSTGGSIYLMEGTYIVDGSINLPNNVTLTGAGNGTVIKLKNAHNVNISIITNTDFTTGTGVTIQNLKIDGNKANQTAGAQNGVLLNGMGAGAGTSARNGAKILNLSVQQLRNSGVALSGSSNNTINSIISQNNGSYGIDLLTSSNNTITGNSTQGNDEDGIYLRSSSNYNTITGNVSNVNFDYGIYVFSSNYNTITGNSTQGNFVGIYVYFNAVSNTVTGNIIDGSGIYGVFISTNANNNTVVANTIRNTGGSTANNAIFVSNADSNTITSNDITDTSATTTNFAINISNSTSDLNYLADNRFSTGTINDLGTGTIYANQSRAVNGGQLTVRTANDTTAFQVQSAAGAALLTVDFTNSKVIVSALDVTGDSTLTGALTVTGASIFNNTVAVNAGTGIVATFSGRVSGGEAINNDEFVTLNQLNNAVAGAGAVTTVGTFSTTNTAANGATIVGNDIIFQSASATAPGMVDIGAQTFAGVKTFDASVNLNGGVVIAAEQTITLIGGTTAQRPVAPVEGMLYYDQTTKQLLIYANGKWQADRSPATKIVAANTSSQSARDGADFVTTGEDSAGAGTGTLDGDQIEINQALDAVEALGGGSVYLTEGTYTVDGPILIPNNTTLMGSGNGTLIQLGNFGATSTTVNIIQNKDTTTGTRVTIKDLRLDGRKSINTSGTQRGISITGMGAGAGSTARDGAKVNNVTVRDMRSEGIRLTSSANNTLTSNTTQGNRLDGIALSGTSNNTITGNIIQGNGFEGIYLFASSSNNTITGNTIQGNSFSGILLDASLNNTITGNTIQGNGTRGIHLFASSSNTVAANKLHDNGGATTNNAIFLEGSDSNTITGNDITDTSATTTNFAINISNSTSDLNYLADNRFSTGTIQDLGTGTIYANQSTAVNGGNLVNRTANSATAFSVQNAAGSSLLTVDSSADKVVVSALDVTGNSVLGGTLGVTGAATIGGILTVTTLGAADTDAVLCYNSSNQLATCSSTFATTADLAGYVQLQVGTPGTAQTGSINVDGAIISGSLSSATLDLTGNATVGGTLEVTGTSTFTGTATFNGNVTIAAEKTITLVGGITSTRPASPTEGMLYYDQTTKQLLIYSNGKWQADRSPATKIVAASTSSQSARDGADFVTTGEDSAGAGIGTLDGDQIEINQALDAVEALGGGSVYLTEGTYTVDGAILVPNNTTLIGSGNGTLIQLGNFGATSTAINIIENKDTVTGTRVTIKDLRLDGRDSINTAGVQYGIRFNGMGAGSGGTARDGAKVTNVTARDVRTGGILLVSSANSVLTGNTAQGNGTRGITVSSSSNNSITGNIAQGNGTDGILLISSSNNTIIGNVAQGNGADGISLSSSSDNTVTGNTVQGNGLYGIFLITANSNTITANKLHDNGGATANNAIFLSASDANTITSNDITDTSATTTNFAINISNATSDLNYLADNRFSTGTIQDLGTGTIYANQSTAANGARLVTRTANDTAAFQIQNAAGASLLTVDSSANKVIVSALDVTGASVLSGTLNVTGATTLGGILTVNTLSATTSDAILCRNASNQLSACTSTFVKTQDLAGYVQLQSTTPGTAQTGNINISGATIAGSFTQNGSIAQNYFGGLVKIGTTATPTLVSAKLFVTETEVQNLVRIGTAANGVEFSGTSAPVFRGTARPTRSITLTPEYAGATVTGDGANNIGTMTSDFCSGTARRTINTTICAATDEHNYYSWTAQATNDYDVYIRYQIPSDFDGFTSSTAVQMFGWRSTSNESVEMALFNQNGVQCGTNSSVRGAGTDVATTNLGWSQVALSGLTTTGTNSCTDISAGSIVTVRIKLTVGSNNNFARAGGITLNYFSKF